MTVDALSSPSPLNSWGSRSVEPQLRHTIRGGSISLPQALHLQPISFSSESPLKNASTVNSLTPSPPVHLDRHGGPRRAHVMSQPDLRVLDLTPAGLPPQLLVHLHNHRSARGAHGVALSLEPAVSVNGLVTAEARPSLHRRYSPLA